jgi:hypothetical protein
LDADLWGAHEEELLFFVDDFDEAPPQYLGAATEDAETLSKINDVAFGARECLLNLIALLESESSLRLARSMAEALVVIPLTVTSFGFVLLSC